MNTQAMNDIRELDAEEINLIAGGAANPWVVRIAVKLIILGIDKMNENAQNSDRPRESDKETGNRI